MYDKIKTHYYTRYFIKMFSIVILIIGIIIMFINSDMGFNLLMSLILCLVFYLIGSFLIMLPLRLKPEFKEYKVMAKDEIKKYNEALAETQKNKQPLPKQQLTKSSIAYIICVIVIAVIPKDLNTAPKNTTKYVASEVQKVLSSSLWSDMYLKPAPAMPENYGATIYKPVEKYVSIFDFDTFMSLEIGVYGSSETSDLVFATFGEGLNIFIQYRPEKREIVSTLVQDIPKYTDKLIAQLKKDPLEPSMEYKLDEDLTFAMGGQIMYDNTISFHTKIFYRINKKPSTN